MKTCSKCKTPKSTEEFNADNNRKDGLQSICKECRKLYYQNNKELYNTRRKKHYNKNKEHYKKLAKMYYASKKEEIKEYYKIYREKNKEKI